MDFCCGHPDEWQYFQKNYKHVVDELNKAQTTCIELLTMAKPAGQEQKALFSLGFACLRESQEICVLAGNGYGTGATKLLRAFYERVVTLGYLALKPEKVQQFIDYSSIHWRKLLTEAETVNAAVNLPPELKKKIEDDFENSKERFMEDVCEPHKKPRLQMSWTKLPIPEQAKKVNEKLRQICFSAYLVPTFYLHTTHFGIGIQHGLERENACEALQLTHFLLVQAISVINRYFKLGQDDRVENAIQGLTAAWSSDSNGTSTATQASRTR